MARSRSRKGIVVKGGAVSALKTAQNVNRRGYKHPGKRGRK